MCMIGKGIEIFYGTFNPLHKKSSDYLYAKSKMKGGTPYGSSKTTSTIQDFKGMVARSKWKFLTG